jgi:amidase
MNNRFFRKHFLIVQLLLVMLAFSAQAGDTDWWHDDVAGLQARLAAGEISAEALVQAHLDRIEALDGQLKSVLAIDPTALEQARALDKALAEGQPPGPLHGIPILLKDNIETAAQPTTAGSQVLLGNRTERDAALVTHLREAGAVILGKTNLSQWANFRSTRSSSGWSSVGGQTRNPYDLSRSPCGSSSGSGAAVSAGFAVVAIGTETNGSIVCPASANGNAAIKPTVGLVSRTGIVPISQNMDTAGPMARRLSDAVVVLAAMMGEDENDEATRERPEWQAADLLNALDHASLEGRRIGVISDTSDYHPAVGHLLDQAIERLEAGGAKIITDLAFDWPDGFGDDFMKVLLTDFSHDLNRYLAGLPDDNLSRLNLSRVIAFNRQHAKSEMPWFEQELFEQAAEQGPVTDEDYLQALKRIQAAMREEGIDKLLAEHELHALIAPTGGPAWTIDLINGDHFSGGSSTPAAVAGYPNVTVPMGAIHGLPIGLSFFGARYAEPQLISIAHAFEQAGEGLEPPPLQSGTP